MLMMSKERIRIVTNATVSSSENESLNLSGEALPWNVPINGLSRTWRSHRPCRVGPATLVVGKLYFRLSNAPDLHFHFGAKKSTSGCLKILDTGRCIIDALEKGTSRLDSLAAAAAPTPAADPHRY